MRYIFILLAMLCVSCGTALPTIKPYKLDVQQGNVVTSKMLLQLRPGMTKSQVRFIMGTPLIQDSFHGNRWDYVYQMREGGKIIEQRRVILDFENELLKSVRGDVIPAGGDQSKAGESKAETGTRVITPSKKTEEKGFMSKLKFWEKDEAELAKEAAEKEAAAKAKLEAEAAKKAAAEVKENAAPVSDELKSMLAVPIESSVLAPASVEPDPVPTPAPAVVAEPAPIESVAPQSPVAPMDEVVAQPPVQQQLGSPQPEALPAPVESPAKTPSYASSSGMLFDRKLRFGLQEPAPEAAPAVAEPRAGNMVPPKPKDLPEESSPNFFDQMLEKIGF